MATYYNNSEIEGVSASDGLQTLILMNPTTPYPQHHLGPFPTHPGQQPQTHNNILFLNSIHQQQLVGIPLNPHRLSHHEIPALHHAFAQRVNCNIYDPSEPTRTQQGGLSLSLSAPPIKATSSPKFNYGVNTILGSRYLKATQELLDEVVSVSREVVETKVGEESSAMGREETSSGRETGRKRGGGEISMAERQEIQMRKAKLVGMLDEVEQWYRQYHDQMQIVISWFEQATGIGSAKTYTSLALQTISQKFRCLKDAISTQIRASSKSLGEEDSFNGGKNEGSRIKFVNHQIRHQRALQQLGMIQPKAWTPQRGLPERAVSVLRAWLFEHFLHPYPKDSDKIMLAKQTGLTRSQVSNWFINARVRLWKPMVEEMYMEEVKEQEHKGSDNKTTKSENSNEESISKSKCQQQKTPATENQIMNFESIIVPTNQNSPPVIPDSPSPNGVNIRHTPGSHGSPNMETIASLKKQRNTEYLQSPQSYVSNEQISMKFGGGDDRQNRESFTLMGNPTNFIGGFGTYPIGEIGRFGDNQFPTTYSGNGVALTLGLPHNENVSLSGAHQSFLQNQNFQMGRRFEIGEQDEFATINTSNPSHSPIAYEGINIQNRKRFAAQLLPDFVA